jgi:hypothetical protein
MVLHLLTWDFLQKKVPVILRVHAVVEIKPSFIAQQNEYRVYFSSMYYMKAPVHKIQPCFMSHVTGLVNHTSGVEFHADDTNIPICCASQVSGFIGDVSS